MNTVDGGDILAARIAERESKVKSPGFAAILAFFFPVLGCLYARKYGLAVLFLVVEIGCFFLAFVGIGIALMALTRLFAAYLSYTAAERLNTASLRTRLAQAASVALVLLVIAPQAASAKTHKESFEVPCGQLWLAVKDTLRNSGKYGIIGIDNGEMTASYNMGGNLTGKRINSLVLNPKGEGCELQVQTAFSGLVNNDAGDLKKRIRESLDKLAAKAPEKK